MERYKVTLDGRELATVLAALRHFQASFNPTACATDGFEHFEDVEPLTTDAIDELCERIGCDDGMPWCTACRSYHVRPTSKEHHAALQCMAPWKDKPRKFWIVLYKHRHGVDVSEHFDEEPTWDSVVEGLGGTWEGSGSDPENPANERDDEDIEIHGPFEVPPRG